MTIEVPDNYAVVSPSGSDRKLSQNWDLFHEYVKAVIEPERLMLLFCSVTQMTA
jgi:hypothetical protein